MGHDGTHRSNISQVEMKFAKNGMLEKVSLLSPGGMVETSSSFRVRSWSKNKWVLQNLNVSKKMGAQELQIKNNFEYISVAGFGFPKKILVTREIKGMNAKGKKKTHKTETAIEITNYRVNTKEARKKMIK